MDLLPEVGLLPMPGGCRQVVSSAGEAVDC
jgi:hypothetical protein